MGDHVLQHLVAAPEAVLGVDARVVGASCLEQADEHSALLDFEVTWRSFEIGVGRRLDTEGQPYLGSNAGNNGAPYLL